MRIHLVAVGRLKAGALRDLFHDYERRLASPLSVHEVEERGKLAPTQLAEREAVQILAAIPTSATVIALDERGKSIKSTEFAGRIAEWRDGGIRDLVFVIGGAGGLTTAIRSRADLILSFGSMTWPHMICRVMLIEQIYRAQTILAGHPYHRE